ASGSQPCPSCSERSVNTDVRSGTGAGMTEEHRVGELVFVPRRGVGTIREIRDAASVDEGPMCVVGLARGDIYWVPLMEFEARGLRSLMGERGVELVYGILRQRMDSDAWEIRRADYENRLATGDPLQMAGLLRSLADVRVARSLTEAEHTLYERVESLLTEEVATVRGQDVALVRQEIETLLSG